MTTHSHAPFLGRHDPDPVRIDNPLGRSPFLLIGDHAGVAIPAGLGELGLQPGDLARHIACDIGIRALGGLLAARLDAVFVHQHYSRLVIDCNRDPDTAEAIPATSDGTVIPGNAGLDAAAAGLRRTHIHAPYQAAIAAEIDRRAANDQPTILVSLHSFTPVMAGLARPWDAGVLHDGGDAAFALAMLAALAAAPGLVVGDNEPYRMDGTDHTVPRHAYPRRLPYVELEVRQDGIADPAGQARWCGILADALRTAACAGGSLR